MAVLGQLLDKSWTLPDLFKYQIYCKNKYEQHFPRRAFRIDFSNGFWYHFCTSWTAANNSWVSLGLLVDGSGWLGVACGNSWAALGEAQEGGWKKFEGS